MFLKSSFSFRNPLLIHISQQFEIFGAIKGDVTVIHHCKSDWDFPALEGQLLHAVQIRHMTDKTVTSEMDHTTRPNLACY